MGLQKQRLQRQVCRQEVLLLHMVVLRQLHLLLRLLLLLPGQLR
jgi:hypothetical protein